ncbi:methyl-accepting chemotaxis protein [Sulfuriferula sp. AH1]|uniref:methyl-accepting chemotaxis protein n=1 Tax=Sulfuriferula sp. AH1 TaxID=1985873 RepID=UPI000B3B7F3B|nr:methyl-accepting chemotaxis protein [Sulfuriferula sp. AH1]ARU30506.1 methyl-accepting chemotaxis protein [Sulfuriferula sp. AH1]
MLKNIRIKTLLISVIGFLSLLLIAIGSFGLYNQASTNESLRTVYEDRTVALGQLDKVVRGLISSRLSIANAIIEPDEANIRKRIAELEGFINLVDKNWSAYQATSQTPDEKKLADKLNEARNKFLSEGLQPALAALKNNNVEEAKRLTVTVLRPDFEPVRENVNNLIKLQLDIAKAEYDKSQQAYSMSKYIAISAIALGVLLAAFFGMFLIRAISRPLEEAIQVASNVAAGDLTQQIEIDSANEFGRLLQALKNMNASLVDIVGEVRNGTESIASASGQIAAGNLDLSNRTESQASSLEETASAMEELTSTVRQNADNARQANQLAETASEVAGKGGAVVSDVVNTMSAINDSARKIADIIGVIDGIAFQTNILALNAAVEAARAGEQGRGFAVVATEVRSLAQRSAAAAKEIKLLIDDSVDKVEQGNKQAAQAGTTMSEVVSSVQRVTDIMSEISAASREQSQGIEEINQAVTQMDEATQQNAALVEEAAAAAKSLQDQAGHLEELVNRFKLNDTQHRAQPPRVPMKTIAGGRPAASAPRTSGKSLPQTQKMIAAKAASDEEWEEF